MLGKCGSLNLAVFRIPIKGRAGKASAHGWIENPFQLFANGGFKLPELIRILVNCFRVGNQKSVI
jgi:hypothetical protein